MNTRITMLAQLLIAVICLGADNIDLNNTILLSSKDTVRSAPIIALDSGSYDFGKIELGTIAERQLTIHNYGSDTLVIANVQASCGCTAALVYDKRVSPHGFTRMNVKFDSRNKATGSFAKSIKIESNATNQPTLTAKIHGIILMPKGTHDAAQMHIDGIFSGECASCHAAKAKENMEWSSTTRTARSAMAKRRRVSQARC